MIKLYDNLKKYRKFLLFICDLLLWNISFYLSYAVSRDSFSLLGDEKEFFISCMLLNICFCTVFHPFKLYEKMWRYADVEDFFYVEIAVIASNVVFFIVTLNFKILLGFRTYILTMLMSSFLLFIFRLVYRLNKVLLNKNSINSCGKKMLIVGAGETTLSVLKEIFKSLNTEYIPICIVDDDKSKIGRTISGIKIVGSTYKIPKICIEQGIDIILFSMSNITALDKKRILDICAKTNLEVKIIPNINNLLTANASIFSKIRRVEVEDLLARESVKFDTKQYGDYIINKTILVTGGGGSIGGELCKQIARLSPKKIIVLDICENGAYNIQQELLREHKNINLEIHIASIRDYTRLQNIFNKKKIDIVFHAAAHKHVPLMELNPEEAVKNNIFGTLNLVTLSDKYRLKKFIQISTDKAVNPTNIMGASKRVCEMIVQSMGSLSKTEFVAVRFGNVLGSNGSVIPLFKEQIKAGGPVTVTHPEIIRYFMTIPEAVSLVLTAASIAKGGEIFILDMGEPVKIKDLAENLIRLSGLTPYKDIKIEYTGLRPGEKLYEELLLDEEGIKKTKSEKIYIGKPIDFDGAKLMKDLDELYKVANKGDREKLEKLLEKIVPNFKHNISVI
ncbi:MAG: polysaccharide biosynthesis protein [Oscillospiraceae bacterium]|jgi:FlaA1/EpsC-like NDP-sugar epimerase|nr:polysaccharide biosynthesis protein [Oscillospiraceae bacterium]